MSSDNGIYILQSKDGYRAIHAQAIENLYWHPILCCINQEIIWARNNEGFDIEKCNTCGAKIKRTGLNILNTKILLEYFGNSKVFKIVDEALEEANKLYNEYEKFGYIEYGISFIREWENKDFTK